MAIPGFQDVTLPFLQAICDGSEHRMRDLVTQISDQFHLSQDERSKLLPSGQQTVIGNRVSWARTYLVKAGLAEKTRRGFVRITDEGRRLAQDPPAKLDVEYLRGRYPGVMEFTASRVTASGSDRSPEALESAAETPQETLETAYQFLREQLAKELLVQVKEIPPESFERLVVDLLVRMGYGGTIDDAGQAVGRSGDGGIDGIIKEDRLGLDVIYIQAKRYDEQSVGRPAIQTFVGALEGRHANKGIFLTTSRFAQSAREYAATVKARLILIDGAQLAEYMIDYNLGVTTTRVFEVKCINSDYFTEE